MRCLHEYHLRLLHNILPAPSGIDIANNIKYFSQTLLSKYNFFLSFFLIIFKCFFLFFLLTAVLKDVRTSPHELIRDPLEDPTRMAAYPNLEYGNLYNALTILIDVAPSIQYGQVGKKQILEQLMMDIKDYYPLNNYFNLIISITIFSVW